jgi:hypothetical protein
MENKPEYYLEHGKIVCKVRVGLDDEHRENVKEYLRLCSDAQVLKRKVGDYLKICKLGFLPPDRTMETFEINSQGVFATYKFNQNYYFEKPIAPKIEPTPENPNQKYIDLANRYDFKQILGSGILTKNEKRKCLGLPEIVEEKHENAKS